MDVICPPGQVCVAGVCGAVEDLASPPDLAKPPADMSHGGSCGGGGHLP
jgi:hypothetical protein